MSQRQTILDYAANQYSVQAEYLWQNLPDYAVLRHASAKGKWFALIGRISKAKLGLPEAGETDFLNLKCVPDMVSILQQDKNVLPAYHMNKKHWLTIVLDRGFDWDEMRKLIDWSYDLTQK
ncbi:hypothetical protein A4G20_04985 [Pasteurellaceae bacterium RH1A]|nr:hypothetical protein A4G20_04985 [Pasteurellaceae bacterium RH1A]